VFSVIPPIKEAWTRRLFLLIAVATTLLAEDFSGKVVAITDGDTIRVMRDGRSERVRLWGVDCPEARQPFDTRSKQFTGGLAFGQTVTGKVRDIDRYNRFVGEIILPDGRNLNRELVRAGFAWWYEMYARRETVLRDLQSEARAAKRGLWSDPKPVPPWEWRRPRGPAAWIQVFWLAIFRIIGSRSARDFGRLRG
jgi:endonuclease YncB( thermonuclease family)